MDNSISNVSFTARLRTTNFKISNPRRLKNISQKFSEETAKFSDEKFNLCMTEQHLKNGKEPVMELKINADSVSGNNISGEENSFVTKTFDKYLATMTDTQIVKKLVKIFNVLHYKNVLTKKLPAIKTEYERAISELDELKPQATGTKEKELVKEIELTIKKLQNQYTRIRTTARQNIRRTVRGDAELEKITKDIL